MTEAPDDDARESARLEAFSDGVFAIAITLLVLELKVPPHVAALGPALWERWPSYVAFLLSFTTIGIMWLNHHRLFAYIRRVNHWLIVINGFLLLGVTFLPFPTALLAIQRQYGLGIPFYSGLFAVSWWWPRVGMAGIIALALFFAVPLPQRLPATAERRPNRE